MEKPVDSCSSDMRAVNFIVDGDSLNSSLDSNLELTYFWLSKRKEILTCIKATGRLLHSLSDKHF